MSRFKHADGEDITPIKQSKFSAEMFAFTVFAILAIAVAIGVRKKT